MDLQQLITQFRDIITARMVFGDPYEGDGVTIIPAAKVQGGGGGGGGEDPRGEARGGGGGGGLSARPVGAYVIKDGSVTWQPAVDVNRAVTVAGAVAIVAFLSIRSIARARAKSSRAGRRAG
jgi:uncharacterized spore protein YtfJ